MTVSPAIRDALEASRDTMSGFVAAAPKVQPKYHPSLDMGHWLYDSKRWDVAQQCLPALEKINAALAEMEAQS